jgi:Ca2+-binding RTX toxin-like protein
LAAGGTDLLFLGAGFRLNLYQMEALEIYGRDGNDLLTVGDTGRTSLRQIYFEGGAGSDTLDGAAATLALLADGGADRDNLTGGRGNDTLRGGSEADVLAGGAGADLLDGGTQADRLIWAIGDGDDTLIGGTESDVADLRGSDGDDFFAVNTAGSGTLDVEVPDGATLDIREIETIEVSGGLGDDLLSVGDPSGTPVRQVFFSGGAGNDVFVGAEAASWLVADGGSDNDTLIGGTGADSLNGSAGDDVLLGGGGADLLSGESGDDQINGDGGTDQISGGSGDDTLNGGDGADVIDGGGGEDLLWGDGGADVFVYGADQLSNGFAEGDLLVDYSAAQGDVVDLPDADASVLTSFLLDGNLVVVLTGGDGDLIEFVDITSLTDIDFV